MYSLLLIIILILFLSSRLPNLFTTMRNFCTTWLIFRPSADVVRDPAVVGGGAATEGEARGGRDRNRDQGTKVRENIHRAGQASHTQL